MTKAELIQLITDSRSHDTGDTIPKSVDDHSGDQNVNDFSSLTNQMMAMFKPMLDASLNQLSAQLKDTQAQLVDLQAKMDAFTSAQQCLSPESDWATVVGKKKKDKSFPEVLRQTMSTALHEERTKCDVIISGAPEGDNDTNFIADLCQTMNFDMNPRNQQRLGTKGERPRLLKATFPSPFDARTFIARYDQKRRENTENLPKLKIRSSKTKAEQAAFSQGSKLAFALNKKAKDDGLPESFSLRDDGSVWKFVKSENGRWRREDDWVPPSGNQ